MQSDEMTSYLPRPTGRVLTVSDEAFRAAEDDDEESVESQELAEARSVLAAEDEYLALPDRLEIDEYRMMERFATGLDDAAARDEALAALRGRGAFRFFKGHRPSARPCPCVVCPSGQRLPRRGSGLV